MYECEFCKLNPSLHSFKVQDETDTAVTFYTLLGEAKDKNPVSIISHIRGNIDWAKEKQKKIIWIVDSRIFHFEWHTLGLTKQLIRMFGDYKESFLEIKVINLNKFMKFLLNVSRPFMGNDIKNILHY